MPFTQLTTDLNNIQALTDQPNATSGLTPTQLKAAFDAAGNSIKTYINGTLISELENVTAGASGAHKLGSAPISGVTGADVYTQLSYIKAQLDAAVIGTIPNGTLDYAKLNTSTKEQLTLVSEWRQTITNGGYDIWQRGTSFSAVGYTADRWYADLSNATVSRQSSGVPYGSKYCLRATMTGTGYCNVYQAFESITCSHLAGKTVTFSIKVRRNSIFTAAISAKIYKNTTPDTLSGGTWTQIAGTTLENGSIPTGTSPLDWYELSCSVTIPTDGTGSGIYVKVEMGPTVPVGAYFEIAQAQLTVSDTPLPFQPRSYHEELAHCQRYYEKSYNDTTVPGTVTIAFGLEAKVVPSNTIASTQNYGKTSFRVKKRGTPTITIYPYATPTNTNRVTDGATGLDLGANSGVPSYVSDGGFATNNNSGGTLTVTGNIVVYHWAADIEI